MGIYELQASMEQLVRGRPLSASLLRAFWLHGAAWMSMTPQYHMAVWVVCNIENIHIIFFIFSSKEV